ncbi:C40 family peptidase [Actinomadura flavalba]|uniref:C40 family peptidase n=1 Tax=Actinomadura flavalba TaxID=1120938 RepID=UPI00036CD0C1|nr:C40 family peptidase [Actinomadura flavalba]
MPSTASTTPSRRRTAPALTLAALVALGVAVPGVVPGARPAAAEPTPSASELEKRLDKLHTEAEIATEKYNKTRVDLDAARKAQRAAAEHAALLEAQAAPARERLAGLAAANYMGGGPDTLFGAGGREGLTENAYLAHQQARTVAVAQAEIDKANAAKRAADARTAQVQRAADGSAKARAAAKAKVADVQKQLDKVSTTKVKDPGSGLTATVRGTGLPAKMTRKAMAKMGSPYVWAAAGPNSFDCSGLVVWAYAQVGKKGLPHYTGSLYALGEKVGRGSLRSGDLVYFGGSLHHMGIYLSNGLYLHAPRTGDVVKISKLSDRSDYAGANRIS